jgi:hypothetical protein
VRPEGGQRLRVDDPDALDGALHRAPEDEARRPGEPGHPGLGRVALATRPRRPEPSLPGPPCILEAEEDDAKANTLTLDQ